MLNAKYLAFGTPNTKNPLSWGVSNAKTFGIYKQYRSKDRTVWPEMLYKNINFLMIFSFLSVFFSSLSLSLSLSPPQWSLHPPPCLCRLLVAHLRRSPTAHLLHSPSSLPLLWRQRRSPLLMPLAKQLASPLPMLLQATCLRQKLPDLTKIRFP